MRMTGGGGPTATWRWGRLFGRVGKVRASALMQTFGAELVGNQRTSASWSRKTGDAGSGVGGVGRRAEPSTARGWCCIAKTCAKTTHKAAVRRRRQGAALPVQAPQAGEDEALPDRLHGRTGIACGRSISAVTCPVLARGLSDTAGAWRSHRRRHPEGVYPRHDGFQLNRRYHDRTDIPLAPPPRVRGSHLCSTRCNCERNDLLYHYWPRYADGHQAQEPGSVSSTDVSTFPYRCRRNRRSSRSLLRRGWRSRER